MTNRDHEEFRLHPGSTLEISYLDDSSGKTQFFITNASQPAVKEERSDESPLSLHVDFHPEGKHDGLLELENYWGEPVLVLGGAFWELSRNDADGVAITTLPGCEQAKFGCSVEHGQHGIIPSTVDYTRPNGWMRILLITLSAGDGTIDVAVEWPENVDAIVSWSGDLVTPLGDVPAQHKG